MGTGRARPESSGSPSSILMHLRPVTQPSSSPSTSTGLVSQWNSTPSWIACSCSSTRAVISWSLRRYTIRPCSAPTRRAVRTVSMAVLPAPITATRLPTMTGVSAFGKSFACIRFTRVRNSLAEYTPLRFSPGIPMKLGRPAPVPTNTAEKPISPMSSSIVMVLPMITLH